MEPETNSLQPNLRRPSGHQPEDDHQPARRIPSIPLPRQATAASVDSTVTSGPGRRHDDDEGDDKDGPSLTRRQSSRPALTPHESFVYTRDSTPVVLGEDEPKESVVKEGIATDEEDKDYVSQELVLPKHTNTLSMFPNINGSRIRTQKQVQHHFGPILQEHGNVHRKISTSFLRRAKKNEIIHSDNGVEITIQNNTSWVACPPSGDGMPYVLSKWEFQQAYDPRPLKDHLTTTIADVSSSRGINSDYRTSVLAARRFTAHSQHTQDFLDDGYKEYQSKRQVWAYQVTKEDLDWFRNGKEEPQPPESTDEDDCEEDEDTFDEVFFMAPWGEQQVQVGHYLVLQYPQQGGSPEIYRVPIQEFTETYEPVGELFAACFAGHAALDENLIKTHKNQINDTDKYGATPLHQACAGGHARIVSLLLEQGANANVATTGGETPLYIACQNNSLEIVQALMEEDADINSGPSQPGSPSKAKTPFMLLVENESYDLFEYLVSCGSSSKTMSKKIVEGIDHTYGEYKKNRKLNRKFRRAVFRTLQYPAMNHWLNSKSSGRGIVFELVLDLYCHTSWICILMHGTTMYLSPGREIMTTMPSSLPHSIGLAVVSAIFLVQERIEYLASTPRMQYWHNRWNYFELGTNLLVLACAVVFGLGHDSSSLAEMEGFQRLFMATALCQFAYLIAFLRNTFLPFAKFVGGSLQIISDLLPFFITMAFILLAFGFGYFVQDNTLALSAGQDEEPLPRPTLFESFANAYEMLVIGPPEVVTYLDAAFGLIIVIILLNVVIAIITQSWDEATEKADRFFWDFRLDYIEECSAASSIIWKSLGYNQSDANGNVAPDISSNSVSHRFESSRRAIVEWLEGVDKYVDRSKTSSIAVGRASTRISTNESIGGGARNSSSRSSLLRQSIQKGRTSGPIEPQDNGKSFWVEFLSASYYVAQYVFFLILGCFSFGLLWPKQIRMDIFGSNQRLKPTRRRGISKRTNLDDEGVSALLSPRSDAHSSHATGSAGDFKEDVSDGLASLKQQNTHLKQEVVDMKQEISEMKILMGVMEAQTNTENYELKALKNELRLIKSEMISSQESLLKETSKIFAALSK